MSLKLQICTLLFIILFIPVSNAQNSRGEYGVYNTVLGSVVGGVGAVINKKPDEKFGKVLFKGMWQGALGGFIVHESKMLIGKISEENSFQYSWYSKFVNAAGNSIIENAAMNRNFYDQWNINFGFNRFEFHTKNKFGFRYKVMPVSLVLTGYVAVQSKFEWEKSLQTGEMIFSTGSSKFSGIDYAGVTIGTAVVMNSDYINDKATYGHEFIHVYQYYDYNFVNTFVHDPVYKLTDKWLGKANKFIYYDFNSAVLDVLYSIEYEDVEHYYDNFFEREAALYSHTLH